MTELPTPTANQALEALPCAVIVFDARYGLVLANQRMLALAGAEARGLAPGTRLRDVLRMLALRGLYGPDDPDRQVAELMALDRTRASRRVLRQADGTVLELRVQPLADGGFLSCLTDMTLMARPLETAMEDLRRLEAVFGQIGHGIALFGADDRLLLNNAAFPRLTGLPAARLQPGLSLTQIAAQLVERGEMTAEDAQARAARREVEALDRRLVEDRLRPNGRVLRITREPLSDGAFLHEVTDVTAERQAQAEAQRRAAVLDGILGALPVGVVVWGADRRAVLVNDAYNAIMLDSPVRVGDDVVEILSRRARAGRLGEGDPEALVESALADVHLPKTFSRRLSDGQMVDFRSRPLGDGSWVVVVNDVTPLYAAQAEASARADLLRTMLDGMRHGIALFDRDHRVLAANRLAAELCGLPAEAFVVGASIQSLRAQQVEAGALEGGAAMDRFMAERPADTSQGPYSYVRTRPDGMVIEVRTDPVPGGGFVRTYSDISGLRRAEAQLSEQAGLMSTMLEGMPHGVALFREDGTLLAVNSLTNELTALSEPAFEPGQHIGRIAQGVADELRFGTEAELQAFLDSAGAHGLREGRYTRRNARGRMLEVVTDRLAGGGFLRTFSDVTELHDAQAQAQARAAMLETMLGSIRHGLVMYGPDTRLIAANPLASQLTGVPDLHRRDDLNLARMLALQKAAGGFGEGEAADALERWFLALDRTRPQAFQRLLPDGRIFEVVSDPVADGGFVVTLSDVSKLVAAEADAKRRAEVLGAMLENIRHGICLFDDQGRVLAANRMFHELLGVPAEVLEPGALHRDFVAELLARGEFGEGEAAAATAAILLSRDHRVPYRNVRMRPDGRVIDVVSDPIAGGGFVMTYTDITTERGVRAELEFARDAAEAANAAKGRFLATMSHELRTPLTAVIGFAEALRAHPDAAARDEYLATIHDAGRHLLGLINDILDVAKAEHGGLSVQVEPVDVGELLEGVGRVMRSAATVGEVELTIDAPAGLPGARADALRLRQVLLNLVSNAIKFTPSGGSVRVEAVMEPDGAMLLRVTDTGIGMEEADIPRAFQPFNQLDSSLSRRFEGSGLGLHLSRTLAEAQGAELTLQSRPGEGTVATLRIPPERVLHPVNEGIS